MEITKLCMFMSIVLTTLICKAECQFFNVNPQNVKVTEGSNVTFTCGSDYLPDCTDFCFSWQRKINQNSSNEQISSCSRVTIYFVGRSSFIVELDSNRYHLRIINVQLEDTGTYWCDMHNAGQRISEKALLTVNPLLPEHNPSCDFEPEQPRVGSIISLKCTLSERDPQSLLTWFESASSGPIQIEDKTGVIPGETYTVERVLSESDNMREFTCVAGPRPDGPNCSITPLQIPTTVSISPSHLTLHDYEDATFTCDLTSTPKKVVDVYKWRVFLVDQSMVKVNGDTVQSLDGRFVLDQNGQTLQIINVTPEEFNNSKIRCIAFQDGEPIQSANDSLMFVLPLSTVTVSVQQTDTDIASNPDNSTPKGSGVIIIVGGVIGAIFFLVIIAVLVFYLMKYKHNPTGPGPTAATHEQRPPIADRPTVISEDRYGQTYDEIPQDVTGDRNVGVSSSTTIQAEVLYACADKTGHNEIKRYGVRAPPSTTGEDGNTVSIGHSVNEETGNARDHAIYTMPNKRTKTEQNHPGKNDHRKGNPPPDDNGKGLDTPIEDDLGSHKKNVEGLVYADLDLQRPSSARNSATLQSEEQSEYAEIRRDK